METEQLNKVKACLDTASGIGWDTCHKIYILMDNAQMAQMADYGYECLISAQDATPESMLETLQEWFNNSCSLRFIEAVSSNQKDPNPTFETLIPQFN